MYIKSQTSVHTFFILIFSFLLCFSGNSWAQSSNQRVKLNQLGFYPESRKIAITPSINAVSYHIRDAETGRIIKLGEVQPGGYYSFSDENVRIVDFTDFTTPGSYILSVDGIGESFPFEVKNNIYDELSNALIKAMYYNRASTNLEQVHAGAWFRGLGHPDSDVIIHPSAASPGRDAGSTISSPGGWYDAGDFNKYVVPISFSIHNMLLAYENFPSFFNNRELTIPESGDEVPDLLDETKYALDWLLTMQDPFDGGVYNKLTHANFQGTVMPSAATASRYVVQKGTAATLNFAAVMAQAARIYADFDTAFANQALEAAESAFNWAVANPNMAYDQNAMNQQYDPDIGTGGYGDSNFSDEFFWARSEMYITTKNDSYYPANGWEGAGIPGWPNVQTLGLLSLLTHRQDLTATGLQDTSAMRSELVSEFLNYVNRGNDSAYRSPFGTYSWQFGWGSNGNAGSLGMAIFMAYQLTGQERFYNSALDVMDYLMGRNPVDYSYVTGFGDRPPMNIHHRQSEADAVAAPVPGWVAGGANPNNQSQDCGVSAYNSTLPALSFLDEYCSYSTNEITTYWNSPFIYLTAGLETYTQPSTAEATYPVQFKTPLEGTFYDAKDTLSLEWTSTSIASLDLYYKRYSDTEFTLIQSGFSSADSSFDSFIVPTLPGDSLLFKLQDSNNPDVVAYSALAKIAPSRAITDIFVSSISGDDIQPNGRLTISWATIFVDEIDLYYRLGLKGEFTLIREGLTGGSYTRFRAPDAPGDTLYIKAVDVAFDSISFVSNPFVITSPTSNEAISAGPEQFQLHQNYPNPFNPSTLIRFELAQSSYTNLTVFDMSGRLITELVDGEKPAGLHAIQFDASALSSGLYLYRLTTPFFSSTRKMMLIK